jgi:DNA repair exonuclease SbcCD ATPase subunit
MKEVASFKNETKLETDKKVNIIYGLNGTGKTTISDFLYNKMNPKFSKCSIAVPADELLLVYNTTFIQDNFYEKPNLNGIFTLSKENKIAEENIKKANEKIARLEEERKNLSAILDSLSAQKNSNKKQTEDKTWQIKGAQS